MVKFLNPYYKSILAVLTLCLVIAFDISAQDRPSQLLLIGDTVPSFEAPTSQGIMKFPDDYAGKWKILFSHPANHTPVCTSELLEFALMHDDYKSLDCELIGLSVDGYIDHLEWIQSMENITYKGHENIQVRFPIISDVYKDISRMFGMVHPNASSTYTIRAVFIIDPNDVVRTILYYPETIGRNMKEIKRALIALQTADKYAVSTPADWEPGDDVIVRAPQTKEQQEAFEKAKEKGEIYCLDWYFCFKKLPLVD